MEFLGNFSRRLIILMIQIVIVISAFLLSYLLRFDLTLPDVFLAPAVVLLLPLAAIKLLVFWWMGLFSGWWRYVSIHDLMVLLRANLLGSMLFLPIAILAHQVSAFPRSIVILDGLLCFLMMAGVRVGARMLREKLEQNRKGKRDRQDVLIVGAGAVGQTFVREIRQNPNLNMEIIGFVDRDPQRQRLRFQGIPVLGTPGSLPAIFQRHRIDQVIVAQSAVSPGLLKQIVETCRKAGVQSKILPAVGTILNGEVSIRQVRDVQVEDLLGRPPVQLDIEGIRQLLQDRRILVTGAGGSIGSEICRQVAVFKPARLAILDHAETPLFNIEQELLDRCPDLALEPCLGDIRDRSSIRALFASFRPDVVFHAAAYKHVPMSEGNPIEAIRNNIFGTRIVADCADEFGVGKFVMVSTDKAVNPTNAMGASKRAAEIYVQSLARRSESHMVTVRFGNVLGSNGSVVPTFRRQIEKGGPVTVTHPEVTRYFMTIPEAVQLVLQAGSMGKGGEIFLLDMGEPIRIARLAEEMIRLSGLRLNHDISLVFTGLRPGEKLHEELLLAEEGINPTPHQKIKVARASLCNRVVLERQLELLFRAVRQRDRGRTLELLHEIVPEYRAASVTPTATPRVPDPVPTGQPAAVYSLKASPR